MIGLAISQLSYTLSSVPSTISYQGRITDNLGMPVADGTYSFSFAIYDAGSAGNLLWSEMQDVAVVNSSYQAALGQAAPIPFSVFTGKNAWLEVRFEDQLLSPRRQIVSAPFALKAEGEVPEGGIILGAQSGDANILNLGYLQESDTVGNYYLYKKQAYNPASPRAPQRIAYQGRVMRSDRSSVGNSANLVFSLYDAESGGSLKWTETQGNVPIQNGIFSVELGAVNPIYPTTLSQANLWLAVSVNGKVLSPREKLTSAAYALKVESPVPFGGIVLSPTSANSQLSSKKFTSLGATLKGYYLFQKAAFSSADPAVPLLVNYQGRLSNAAGVAIAGSRDFHFSIYDHLTGPALLWSETIGGVSIPGGIYNVLLGGIHPLTPATFPGQDAFLQIQVIQGATVETLSPRTRITSVPFALSAEGTLPPTSLILGDTVNNPALLNAGFTMTGDTINGFQVYSKTDADITPPTITIVSPQDGMTTNATISIHITYTDSQSGVDTSSLRVYHNDTEVTTLSVGDTSATGSVTGSSGEGGNQIRAIIKDRAGNQRESAVMVYVESGLPPVVNIVSPLDGESTGTNPYYRIEYYDPGSSGVDPSTLHVLLDGQDVTQNFHAYDSFAEWWSGFEDTLTPGPHFLETWVADYFGNVSNYELITFTAYSGGTQPVLDSISPDFTVGDTVVTLSGSAFGNTVKVFFPGTRIHVEAGIISAGPGTIQATVPGAAISGDVYVEKKVNNRRYISNGKPFKLGLPYAYIANRSSHRVTVLDYRSNSVVTSILMPGTSPTPYAVAVSPNGHWLFVANRAIHKVTVVNTLQNTVYKTIPLQCGSNQPTNPQAIAISPDGSRALVGSVNRVISVIEIRKIFDSNLADNSTNLCNAAVTNYQFSGTSALTDLEFSPDGQRVFVTTDGNTANGITLSIKGYRYETGAGVQVAYSSTVQSFTGGPANSNIGPFGVGFLPQMIDQDTAHPWRAIIANRGPGGTTSLQLDEDSLIVKYPTPNPADLIVIDTNKTGHPIAYGGYRVALSPLGTRAYIAFNYTANVGLLDNPGLIGTKDIAATSTPKNGCLTVACTSGHLMEDVVYTPFESKVIGTLWSNTNSAYNQVMVLDDTKVPFPYSGSGTICGLSSGNTCSYITNSSISGPEGIAVWPHFDRDGDKISDLVEAVNSGTLFGYTTSSQTVQFSLNPAMAEGSTDLAHIGIAKGLSNSGSLINGIMLPEEGIGYRHYYDNSVRYTDNWGTLRLIKTIEAIGREWNRRHPEGPRISIGDLSQKEGKLICWGPRRPPQQPNDCHQAHQNGLNADLRYIRNDGGEGPTDLSKPAQKQFYNPIASQELINLFCEIGVTSLYVGSHSDLIQPIGCLMQKRDDHDNHIHIKVD